MESEEGSFAITSIALVSKRSHMKRNKIKTTKNILEP